MGAKKQTIGYHYFFSILFGIGRGPIDELRAIKVGEKMAWEGSSCDNGTDTINKPELFGGEKREGGIQGAFRLQQGKADQVLPGAEKRLVGFRGPAKTVTLPDIKALITGETGGVMGELRGRVTLWFDGLVSSMNPYIKTWSFRVRRAKKGWHNDDPWYPSKAAIWLADGRIMAMNPAHIIYECCTNPAWARGLDTVMIDEDSFVNAANTLCEEQFGLCLVWYRREEIGQFIQTVIDHIGAELYTDRETGKVKLKLIRNDYDPDDLPVFTMSSGLLDITEDDTGSGDTGVNEVIVTGHDPITDNDIQMRAHNLAAFRSQGAPATLDQSYPGLPTEELCDRVAQRDMQASAAGLRKFKVVLDRRGFKIHPGAVFRVQAPSRNVGDIILRAGQIDDGDMLDGRITIDAVQDVFGVPTTSFVPAPGNIWTPPSEVAVPAEHERLIEATYRDVYLARGQADALATQEGESYIATLVAQPSTRSTSYLLLSHADGEPEFIETGEHYFTGSGALVDDISHDDTVFSIEDIISLELDEDLAGQALLVGDEYMRIESYDEETFTFTVARGAVDSWPSAHAAGTRVWLADDDAATDARVYAEGETVEAKVLPRTSSDVLEEANAEMLETEMAGRVARPYPPAGVTVDATSIYTAAAPNSEPVLNWVERNRVTQADALVGFFEATVTPEDGTTYRAKVYDEANAAVPIGTHDFAAAPWTYGATEQAADGSDGMTAVWMELVSVRDGIESLAPRRFRVALKGGYGYSYGFNYGGA